MFDSKLDWKVHIQLKYKSNKAINPMRSLSSTEWGADQRTLMMIYRLLIRFKKGYRCIVYISASSRDLKSPESVSNEVMRISSRCLKSTPISILHIITEKPPLQIRRDKLGLKYYYKVKSLLENPAFKFITPDQQTLYAKKNSPPPFAIRIQKIHTNLNLEN